MQTAFDPQAFERELSGKYGESPSGIAQQLGIDPNVFLALINTESGGNQRALSSAGAVGLTQLMQGTADDLGVNRDDPFDNLLGGGRYLRQQLDRFGNYYDALRAYNAGPTRAANDPTAGAGYASKVLGFLGLTGPDDAPDAPVMSTTQGQAEQSPAEPTTVAGRWIQDAVATVKGYGFSAVLWLVIGVLVLFGLYALAKAPAAAVAAA